VQSAHVRQVQEARVRDAPTDAEVEEPQALQPWRCALEKDT
jgi:hypothetical protein